MPKVKSHSGASKRFAKTASGLFKRSKAFRRHHAWAKLAKRVLGLKGVAYVSAADQKRLERALPY